MKSGNPALIKKNAEIRLSYVKALALIIESEKELATKFINFSDSNNSNSTVLSKYQWTGLIVDLVELSYALVEKLSLRKGDVSVEELTRDIGLLFGLQIKNPSRVYTNIKRRKTDSRTVFLDELRVLLNIRMDNDEKK